MAEGFCNCNERCCIILTIILYLTWLLNFVKGDCLHVGSTYANGSLWHPDLCTECRCDDHVPLCQPISCRDPKCDYSRGEKLELVSGLCCPVCSQTGAPCHIKGQFIPHSMEWTPSTCLRCHCNDGEVQCSNTTCADVPCRPGEVKQNLPGQCCPRCVPTGQSCVDDAGLRRSDGEDWSPLNCVKCVCRDGKSRCMPAVCPDLQCGENMEVVQDADQCCPKCGHPVCSENGRSYEEGDIWRKDSCNTCTCHSGQVICHSFQCDRNLTCSQFHVQVLRDDECCPECVPTEGVCFDDMRKAHYHGDIWRSGLCQFCSCNHANIRCRTARCRKVTCMEGQVLTSVEGQCCPTCTHSRSCVFEGQVYLNGQSWDQDACSVCSCNSGEVQCYHKTCPLCPDGTERTGFISINTHCCGPCENVSAIPKTYDGGQRHPLREVSDSIQPNEKLRLLRNKPVLAYVGKETHLTVDVLDVSAAVSPEKVAFVVKDGPLFGHFVINENRKTAHTFTKQDMMTKSIIYHHHGNSTNTVDFARLQVTDGFSSIAVLLVMRLQAETTRMPVVITNTGGQVFKGDTLKISSDLLESKVHTTEHSRTKEAIYTLIPRTDNPRYGEIMMMVPIPLEGAGTGWKIIGDGMMGAGVARFTQRDIDEGRIYYRHFGNGVHSDKFTFQVSDRSSPPNILRDQVFQITVIEDDTESFLLPATAPGVRLEVTVMENQIVPLTFDHLAIGDYNTSKKDLVYRITSSLGEGEGTVEHVNFQFRPVLQFTQEDVNNRRIIYRPPEEDIGIEEREVSFMFIVSDGKEEKEPADNKLTIKITPVNNSPPFFIHPNLKITLSVGGIYPLTSDILEIIDPDSKSEDLNITILDAPMSGVIEKQEKDVKTYMKAGDKFTYADFLANILRYIHSGRENPPQDHIRLSVSDGPHTAETTIYFNITKEDKLAPALLLSAPSVINVTEGTSIKITRDHIAFSDKDDADSKIQIILATDITHGHFQVMESSGTQNIEIGGNFSQEDVNEGRVSFFANKEIGNKLVTELVHVNVSDSSRNILPMQVISVHIHPIDNLTPTVLYGADLKVTEGGEAALTTDIISVQDVDTPYSMLMFIVRSQPKFGILQSRKPGQGLLQVNEQTPGISFPLADLANKHIFYVQSDHKNKEPASDSFFFSLSDGINESPLHACNIVIQPVNDEAPRIVTEQLFAYEGHAVTLTNSSFYISDLDTPPADLIFTIINEPRNGHLIKKDHNTTDNGSVLQEKSIFSYKDVLDGQVLYKHDDGETTQDSFTLYLSDGNFSDTKTVSVVVDIMGDETPRVITNRGLRIKAGSATVIRSYDLQAADLDTEDSEILYTIVTDPAAGHLQSDDGHITHIISAATNTKSFSQRDIDKGYISYVHNSGEQTGNILFKFKLSDPEGNDLIDQDFLIRVTEDHLPPVKVNNKEFLITEGKREKLTTDFLSFTDTDTDPGSLTYKIMKGPQLGHLELLRQPGIPIKTFTQSDLAAKSVMYVHTSASEQTMDEFTFAVSDGSNEIIQSFHIRIGLVDDALPVLSSHGLRVQEGIRKLITEFDLKAEDQDTEEHLIVFTVVKPPSHGHLELSAEGSMQPSVNFTMEDIYENRVSYMHDGTETTQDSFKFLVSDGTNKAFTLKQDEPFFRAVDIPQNFEITILPVDDGTPLIERNIGLQYLESNGVWAGSPITVKELLVTDEDTPPSDIMFVITTPPTFGILEHIASPGESVMTFTQKDITEAKIRYRLTHGNSTNHQDSFLFDVMDRKPNVVTGNRFHVAWSEISLGALYINVTETQAILQVPVLRTGNLKQYSVVKCETFPGSAQSRSGVANPGLQDFIPTTVQVQFDHWQDSKSCTIIINDDSVYEGLETFYVGISAPTYAVLGSVKKVAVTINDDEDVPRLQFQSDRIQVNETDEYVEAIIVRSGDVSGTVSVICSTRSLTATGSSLTGLESGSDFVSRGRSNTNRVVFPPGVTHANCNVKLIDDTMYERMEQFDLELSDPSIPASLGAVTTSLVVIDGPNDMSVVYLAPHNDFAFPESNDIAEIEVLRQGSDLSYASSVWCATRLSDVTLATPGQDYVANSMLLTFGPGQTSQICRVTLLDDDPEPRLEGNETFVVFLNSPVDSILVQPSFATVAIYDDHLDIPQMAFSQETYTVDEKNRTLNATILRLGDTTIESSVICYTQQGTAQVMTDFYERTFTNDSRVVFKPGEKKKQCTVVIVDDEDFEQDEVLHLKLGLPLGSNGITAMLGQNAMATVTITNYDDVPKIQFEQAVYSVYEPSIADQTATVKVKVIRTGSLGEASSVRCSTRDGSAQSGSDYNPKSLVLMFDPGVRELEFLVDVLYNSAVEWHESFTVQLGPEEPTNSVFGSTTVTSVTILDTEVSGSSVLPAPPIVVSLLHYHDAEQGMHIDPSPGYPLVCITPCDDHYPTVTVRLCKDGGINQTAMLYQWEVAMPSPSNEPGTPVFVKVVDSTLFTSVDKKVLDSIYFRPFFQVRCVAQLLFENGNAGVPLKSLSVTIGHSNPICKSAPFSSSHHFAYQAQSFLANLKYIPPDRSEHPNTIHISVQITHQDGMLPLISTYPLHNLRFLLSESVYRQQHICSNIITASGRAPLLDQGFLSNQSSNKERIPHGPGFDFPHQFDKELREEKTLLIYEHLDLKRCIWQFDAWYHMTELIDLCGGQVVSDFQIKDRSDTYLTIHVPLYVSYLYATAPTGWGSLEHHTEMEISFYYSTVLWKAGLETESRQEGKLQVVRIRIGEDGRLVLEFRTQAKFRGQFVLKHPSLPGIESRIVAPKPLATNFDLDLVWTQNTFDSPYQVWRATSHYSLKNYSGIYQVELVPCLASATQSFVQSDILPCSGQQFQRFEVPISFQQTNRPIPITYSLNTDLQISNSLKTFLMDPAIKGMENEDWNFQGVFSRGEKLYGRVLWSHEQDLKEAYKLILHKVYLCTGSDGYIPTYDPLGEVYGKGPEFGCIQPSRKLLHRFLILDRENQDVTTHFHSLPFNAQFAHENKQYADLFNISGVDGFITDIDPLFKADSGHLWHLQVVYTIGPSDSPSFRIKRSVVSSIPSQSASSFTWHLQRHYPIPDSVSPYSWPSSRAKRQGGGHNLEKPNSDKTNIDKSSYNDHDRYKDDTWHAADESQKNGTNMKVLRLAYERQLTNSSFVTVSATAIAVSLIVLVLFIIIIIYVCVRRRHRKQKQSIRKTEVTIRNNILPAVKNIPKHEYRFSDSMNAAQATSEGSSFECDLRRESKCNIIKSKNTNVLVQKNICAINGTEV